MLVENPAMLEERTLSCAPSGSYVLKDADYLQPHRPAFQMADHASINSSPMTLISSASVISSAVVAGATTSLSAFAIPAVLNAPREVMLRQWYSIYHRGKVIPMLAMATSIGHAAVSYSSYAKGLGWRGWAMASVFTALSIPYTLVVLMPTNRTLETETHSRNQQMSEAEVKRLIKKWQDLNVVRCLLPLAGASWGLWSLLG